MDCHDGTLVGYEPWVERDTLVLLVFDADVVDIASQPFWLFWTTAEGKPRSHAPDYFARLADGSARVLDVRPAHRIKPRDQVAFDATRAACPLMGSDYEVVGAPPGTVAGWPATDTRATAWPTSRPRYAWRSVSLAG
ncbi:hypothetical protein B0I31_111146 [Saccharothrix carnea]|uniref:TnsA endonuclease-like protein n=1 Tax=Saccharothrix carnea TaxID=1280637 RepID=A0A2P8I318_SACCR|nr:TnsA-like heteromeric transposase endonuclease subunit [Saccharothrix carnea]PSL52859.1 hypothetical protein B0I31_111146 [Saccharothrix carnea]